MKNVITRKKWVFNPCFANTLLTCIAMAFLDVSTVSKNLTITWQGSRFSFKKWTIRTNVSIFPLDIQRSKDMMHVLHDWSARKTNLSFVHLVIIGKSSFLNFCLDGKFNQGLYFKINLLKKEPLQMTKAQLPLQWTTQDLLQIVFYDNHFYYKE